VRTICAVFVEDGRAAAGQAQPGNSLIDRRRKRRQKTTLRRGKNANAGLKLLPGVDVIPRGVRTRSLVLKAALLTALRLVALMITSASTRKIAPYEC
jgi:hypothetical protein